MATIADTEQRALPRRAATLGVAPARLAAVGALGLALVGPLAVGNSATPLLLLVLGGALVGTAIAATRWSIPWLGLLALGASAPQLIAFAWTGAPTGLVIGLAVAWWFAIAYACVGCVMVRPLQRSSLPVGFGLAAAATGFAVVILLGLHSGASAVIALVALAAIHALLVGLFALQADRPSAHAAAIGAVILLAATCAIA